MSDLAGESGTTHCCDVSTAKGLPVPLLATSVIDSNLPSRHFHLCKQFAGPRSREKKELT